MATAAAATTSAVLRREAIDLPAGWRREHQESSRSAIERGLEGCGVRVERARRTYIYRMRTLLRHLRHLALACLKITGTLLVSPGGFGRLSGEIDGHASNAALVLV